MVAYNTKQGIISRDKLAVINKQREEEAIKNSEELQNISSYMKDLAENLIKEYSERFTGYIDKTFYSCISIIEKTNSKFKELIEDETVTPEEYKNKFQEFSELLLESLKTCRIGKVELKEILDNVSKSSSNGNNYTIDDISNFLSTLTFEQTVAVLHIFGFITIIISLISLFTVFYGNLLIDYLKLEQRFPRIAKFIQLRRKFQMYYSLLDFTLILIVISIMFYIDILLFNL